MLDATWFQIYAIIAIGFFTLLLILAFFDPGLPYRVRRRPDASIDSPDFVRLLSILAGAQIHTDTHVDVLTDGPAFYEAELEAIRKAKRSICLEAYIFQRGQIARKFIQALTERAQAGVQVSIVLDAIGSFSTLKRDFRGLLKAGGRVEWYLPFRWYNLPRLNNRTHRELLIIDGELGFIGGAGIADHWYRGKKRHPRWRDTMFRVEGDAVSSLMSTFVENWLEASGELLTADEYFAPCEPGQRAPAIVVNSAPSVARSTRARILYQTLLASAQKSIHITTPYFLPDKSVRDELVKAIRERGVDVQVIVPGQRSDHILTRRSSRRLYGELLKAGARIYEYKPSMIHTKTLIVDGLWTVVGSTNFDHRSFGLNDEVNLAAADSVLAQRVEEDFVRDRARCELVRYRKWMKRSPFERLHEVFGWLLERQQ